MNLNNFSCAPYIKEIGRGKAGARSLSYEQAYELFSAILAGNVSDVELGAVFLAFRMKGETAAEMAAFLHAAQQVVQQFPLPTTANIANMAQSNHGAVVSYVPVLLPSYNGARHNPNLLPVLAAQLARAGVPVLVHGIAAFAGRVTSYEIWQALDWPIARSAQDCLAAWHRQQPVFMLIDDLAPRLAQLLQLRTVLGVRNATHTLVKMLQPFAGPALRVISYTHPEYHSLHTEVLRTLHASMSDAALLMRGAEGEAVANPKRLPLLEFFQNGVCQTLLAGDTQPLQQIPALPVDRSAVHTATWIQEVLNHQQVLPDAIRQQQACILRALKVMQQQSFVGQPA